MQLVISWNKAGHFEKTFKSELYEGCKAKMFLQIVWWNFSQKALTRNTFFDYWYWNFKANSGNVFFSFQRCDVQNVKYKFVFLLAKANFSMYREFWFSIVLIIHWTWPFGSCSILVSKSKSDSLTVTAGVLHVRHQMTEDTNREQNMIWKGHGTEQKNWL